MEVKDRFYESLKNRKRIVISGSRQSGKTSLMLEMLKKYWSEGDKICIVTPYMREGQALKGVLQKCGITDFSNIAFGTTKNLRGIALGRTYDDVFYVEPLFGDNASAECPVILSDKGREIIDTLRPNPIDPKSDAYLYLIREWCDANLEINYLPNRETSKDYIFFSGFIDKNRSTDIISELVSTVKFESKDGLLPELDTYWLSIMNEKPIL